MLDVVNAAFPFPGLFFRSACRANRSGAIRFTTALIFPVLAATISA